jgi:hypothetical protein
MIKADMQAVAQKPSQNTTFTIYLKHGRSAGKGAHALKGTSWWVMVASRLIVFNYMIASFPKIMDRFL